MGIHEIRIGANKENDIVLQSKYCDAFHAKITYNTGKWIFHQLSADLQSEVNGNRVVEERVLKKYDKITIGKRTLHWQNYLIEHDQILYPRDFMSINGRINKSNYRALFIFGLGFIPIIYFLPGLLISILYRKHKGLSHVDILNYIQVVAPYIHCIGFSMIFIFLLIISIKRCRDTGHRFWVLLIPIYNLKVLLSKDSESSFSHR